MVHARRRPSLAGRSHRCITECCTVTRAWVAPAAGRVSRSVRGPREAGAVSDARRQPIAAGKWCRPLRFRPSWLVAAGLKPIRRSPSRAHRSWGSRKRDTPLDAQVRHAANPGGGGGMPGNGVCDASLRVGGSADLLRAIACLGTGDQRFRRAIARARLCGWPQTRFFTDSWRNPPALYRASWWLLHAISIRSTRRLGRCQAGPLTGGLAWAARPGLDVFPVPDIIMRRSD